MSERETHERRGQLPPEGLCFARLSYKGIERSVLLYPDSENLEWWPSHVQKAFRALGDVLGPAQLKPEDLELVNQNAIPDHRVMFRHASGRSRGVRKGAYSLTIAGPLYAGEWHFPSGLLEKLARKALKA